MLLICLIIKWFVSNPSSSGWLNQKFRLLALGETKVGALTAVSNFCGVA
jgi:hypothetical protein